ncbi:MAG: DUF5678 domain-containing protein [Candidatus Hadarchaeales archaeon]
MEETKLLELLKSIEEDNKWLSENYDELKKKLEGKVFAVKNKKVVYEAETIEDLLRGLEEKGEDSTLLLIESIPRRDVSFIL